MRWKGIARVVLLLGLTLSSSSRAEWNQAYGTLGNTGFVDQMTNLPLGPRWRVSLNGPVSASGPAIAPDGTVYVATANGAFWGFRADGSVRCNFAFSGATITSTPAITPSGESAILVHTDKKHGVQGDIVLMSPDCEVVWQTELPHDNPDLPSVSSSSVKVWTFGGEPFFFVHSRYSHQYDPLGDDTFHDLLVYDKVGAVYARHPVGRRCVQISGGGGWLGDLWDWITDFWPTAGDLPPLYEAFGWPDSTPAISDAFLSGYSTPSSPLVAVTEHEGKCYGDLNIFQFFPEAPKPEDRLVRHWEHMVEEDALLSSPAVTADGRVAVGTSNHWLRVYSLASRSQVWKHDVKEAMMHPPAIAPDVWVAGSDYNAFLLKPSGALAPTHRPNPVNVDNQATPIAISRNEILLPNLEELTSASYDLRSLKHALTDDRFRTSHPAWGSDGRLYVVTQSNDISELVAF